MANTPDYLQYLHLSEDKQSLFPPQVMRLLWHDPAEIMAVTRQSWFGRLRDELNRGAKIGLKLGAFTFEQSAVPQVDINTATSAIAKELFLKTDIVTVQSFNNLLMKKINRAAGDFFEPSLVVVDGQVVVPYDKRYVLNSYFKLVGRRLGYTVEGAVTNDIFVAEETMDKVLNAVTYLAQVFYDHSTLAAYLKEQTDQSSFRRIPCRSKDFVRSVLLGSNEESEVSAEFCLEMPLDAATQVPPGPGFLGRVLGWAEQNEHSFAIRPIALAQVDAYSSS